MKVQKELPCYLNTAQPPRYNEKDPKGKRKNTKGTEKEKES
jgi:hypothetical protein